MSQEAFGEAAGVGKNTQSNYERDKRAPDTDYLSKAASLGVDVQYVVTGTPTKVKPGYVAAPSAAASHGLAEPPAPWKPGPGAPPLKVPLLAACVQAVELELKKRQLEIDAEQKARLVTAVYEFSLPAGQVNTAVLGPMINLIRPMN